MTTETVIHGCDTGTGLARCDEVNPETTTTNLGAYTCAACILDARNTLRGELVRHHDAIERVAQHLQQLDHEDAPSGPLGLALMQLDSEIAGLKLWAEIDATAQAAEAASDA